MEELNEIEIEKKLSLQEQHRENIKAGVAEKQMYQEMQKNYDKAFGFNDFPYTHGDELEKAQESMTKQWRQELVSELEQKGAIKASHFVTAEKVRARDDTEGELKTKAQDLEEARQNEHMVSLQTGSVVLRN